MDNKKLANNIVRYFFFTLFTLPATIALIKIIISLFTGDFNLASLLFFPLLFSSYIFFMILITFKSEFNYLSILGSIILFILVIHIYAQSLSYISDSKNSIDESKPTLFGFISYSLLGNQIETKSDHLNTLGYLTYPSKFILWILYVITHMSSSRAVLKREKN